MIPHCQSDLRPQFFRTLDNPTSLHVYFKLFLFSTISSSHFALGRGFFISLSRFLVNRHLKVLATLFPGAASSPLFFFRLLKVQELQLLPLSILRCRSPSIESSYSASFFPLHEKKLHRLQGLLYLLPPNLFARNLNDRCFFC